jgi:hypothetical protein
MRVDLSASSFHLHSRIGHVTKFNLLLKYPPEFYNHFRNSWTRYCPGSTIP